MPSKDDLRRRIKTLLENQSSNERLEKSRVIGEKLFGLAAFKQARCVCFYMSMPKEVDTSFMVDKALAIGKRVVLPRCDAATTELRLYEARDHRALEKNNYGILEPAPDRSTLVDVTEVDLVVVPGLVFDKQNNRLGRGRGFYDHFLKTLKPGVQKVGLAYGFQVVDTVPVDAKDVRLDLVLTE